VNKKPVIYWKDQISGTVPAGAGEVILANCTNINVATQNVSDASVGVLLGFTSYSEISDIISNSNIFGMFLASSNNNTIINNSCSNNENGNILYYSDNNIVANNSFNSSSLDAIRLENSVNNKIMNNEMVSSGIFIIGDLLAHWNSNIITINNTVNSKPVQFLKDIKDITVPAGAGEIILANCTNITVASQDLISGTVGLLIGFSVKTNISNNSFCFNNRNGIYLAASELNNIKNNLIIENSGYGIAADVSSGNNSIVLNTFVNNSGAGAASVQAYDDGMNNHWNDTIGEGNFWSDYIIRYPTATNDGHVWNIPYKLNGSAGAEDHYPLFNLTDNKSPIITDQTPNTGNTGNLFKFKVKVLDFFPITNVTVYYWFGSVMIGAKNSTLTYNSFSKAYELSISLPSDSLEKLNYNISARDSNKNWGSTGIKIVTIFDDDAPNAVAGADINTYTGDIVVFNGISSSDNIGIVNATWHFVYNGFDVYRYVSTFDFVFDIEGEYSATLTVRDGAGLTDIDSILIRVLNKTKPTILDLTYPSSVSIGESFQIALRAVDISGMDIVMINYTDVNGLTNNISMTKGVGDNWSHAIPAQDIVGTITFFIYAENIFGNISKTGNYTVNIIDLFIPPISNTTYE
jgi:parallel beta-helix repeat protein